MIYQVVNGGDIYLVVDTITTDVINSFVVQESAEKYADVLNRLPYLPDNTINEEFDNLVYVEG